MSSHHSIRQPRKRFTVLFSESTAATFILANALPGYQFRVVEYHLASAGDNTYTLKSASTAITGPLQLIKGVPHPKEFCDDTLTTQPGEALNITLSAAVAVGGWFRIEQYEPQNA